MARMNRSTGLLLAGALALATSGCGSDDSGTPAATETPEASPAETEPESAVDTTPETSPVTSPVTEPAAEPAASSAPTTAPDDTAPDDSTPDDSTVDDSSSEADLCAALDTVDLDGLLGEPAGSRQPESDDFGDACTVAASDEESRGAVALRVSSNAPEANYENARSQFGVDAEVTGLGDTAFASGPMVVVLDGDRLVTLQAIRWSELGVEGVTQPELEAAMSEVLAALPSGTTTPEGLACALLTAIDIEGLIDESVGAPQDEGDGATDECVVEPENSDSTAYASLTIVDAKAAEAFAESREVFGVDSTVEGLGDEAFHSGPVLAVLDGERAILLWIMGDIMLGANIDDADLEAAMAQVLAGVGGE